MKFKIEAGGTIDTVTPQELSKAMAGERNFWRERATGVKWTELALNLNPPLATTYPDPTPGVNQNPVGPAPGWAWKLRIVTSTLAAAGTMAIYKGESANARLIGVQNNPAILQGIFFPDDIVIQAGQQLFIACSTNMTTLYVGAVQVPAERLGEILT